MFGPISPRASLPYHPKRHRPENRNVRFSGFTLVELLVVIGIIALLIAILLPALSKAKVKAQGAHCMNSLHQLQLAWLIYSGDNNDRLARWIASERLAIIRRC